MPDSVCLSSAVVATSDHVSSDLAEEEIILDLEEGAYYGLNEVRADIWALASSPRRVDEICAASTNEYEVAPDVLGRDVVDLLSDTHEHGLTHVVSEE